jgi:hypothetical protein
MTTYLYIVRLYLVLQLAFNEKRGVNITGHSPYTWGDFYDTHSLTAPLSLIYAHTLIHTHIHNIHTCHVRESHLETDGQ